MYLEILGKILGGEDPGHGKQGYFLASPGSVVWDDLYEAIATAMAKRGLVSDESIAPADGETLKRMGDALGFPAEFVPMMVGGR